jgi:hypothetical protein
MVRHLHRSADLVKTLPVAAGLCHRRAQAIEPTYCEPTYWIGLTTFNMGDPKGGLATMKASLSCRYTAAEALQALNKIYLLMMESGNRMDPGPMVVRHSMHSQRWSCHSVILCFDVCYFGACGVTA